MPYATDDAAVLTAAAFKLARYPDELGPIRLVGVSYSGLETARQDVLFPELDREIVRPAPADTDYETGVSDDVAPPVPTPTVTVEEETDNQWHATQDVFHPECGHGWIQGAGHGVVSVRFETRATGPGRTKSFAADDPALVPADPLDSLDWQDWLTTED